MYRRSHAKCRSPNPVALTLWPPVALTVNHFFAGGMKLGGKLGLMKKACVIKKEEKEEGGHWKSEEKEGYIGRNTFFLSWQHFESGDEGKDQIQRERV